MAGALFALPTFGAPCVVAGFFVVETFDAVLRGCAFVGGAFLAGVALLDGARFDGVFLPPAFCGEAFFGGDFFAGDFFATAFLGVAFLAGDFLGTTFLETAFLAAFFEAAWRAAALVVGVRLTVRFASLILFPCHRATDFASTIGDASVRISQLRQDAERPPRIARGPLSDLSGLRPQPRWR